MFYFYTDDGRILTPPKELKPLLKDSFTAFFKLIGHIRFFYVADEIWDGKAFIAFKSSDRQLAAITLGNGSFDISIGDSIVHMTDEDALGTVFELLKTAATDNQRRPMEQLNADLNEYPSGIRCDMCLLHTSQNKNDFEGCRKFPIMDRNCYFGVEDGWGETVFSPSACDGMQCYAKTYKCLAVKSNKNCLECGEYHTCSNCGVGHNPGECNLGITSEEATCLILPYCEVERLDLIASLSKRP